MRVKPLCRTCKRPTHGPHASYCSHSDDAIAALRLAAPVTEFVIYGREPGPCVDCGYTSCDGECIGLARKSCGICGVAPGFDCLPTCGSVPEPRKSAYESIMKIGKMLTRQRPTHNIFNVTLTSPFAPTADDGERITKAIEQARLSGKFGPVKALEPRQTNADVDFARRMGWSFNGREWEKGRQTVWLVNYRDADESPWGQADRDQDDTRHATFRQAIDAAERELDTRCSMLEVRCRM